MGLQTNTQPHSWIAPASSSFVNLTATNFNFTNGILNTRLDLAPNSCLVGNNTTCVIAGNIAHTLVDSTSSIRPVRGNNTASANYAVVAGGVNNTASGYRSFVGGGCGNTASNSGSVILAGRTNTASGSSALVTTGTSNSATNTDAAVLGGVSNCASGTRSTVGNGCVNIASNSFATVTNGCANSAINSFTFVGNGITNTASNIYSVVVGGSSNNASGSYSFIGAGTGNQATNAYATVNNGKFNTVSGAYSVIGGGLNNRVSGNCSGNLGGCNNVVTHNNSFTVGSNLTSSSDNTLFANNLRTPGNLSAYNIAADGWFYGNGYYLSNLNPVSIPANYPYCWSVGTNAIQPVTPLTGTVLVNAASGICSGVLAGGGNIIGLAGSYSVIAGGRSSTVNSPYGFIGGGQCNFIASSNTNSNIIGGICNSISATNSVIAGGCANSITTGSAYAGVVGGAYNTASSTYAVVVGGSYNDACQSWAAVVGGSNNTASGYSAGVGAGDFNTACGTNSNINGGHRNSINGGASNINGGYYNAVNGWFSGIGSGACNTVNSNFASIVGGNANIANAANTFVLGSNLSADIANYTYVNNLAINTNRPNKPLTVVGDISATGTVYGFLSQLTLPSSLTFTGNGTTSTFDLSSTYANTTPASYIVSLNGASQIPVLDYNIVYSGTVVPGVSTNKLAMTFVPPFGSTVSVILLNSSQFGLGDKTVTANKLDDGALSAIALLAAPSAASIVGTSFFRASGGTIGGATRINGNLTVVGDISATGISYFQNTIYSTTSALSVINIGNTGPAIYVGNNGTGDIASFYDLDTGVEVLHVGGSNGTFPNVGVKTSSPGADFTVNGQISSNNIITVLSGNSNNWNRAYSNLVSNSAAYLSAVDLSFLSVSGNWTSAYNSVTTLSSNWILDGGNSKGSNLLIGTNDAFNLNLEANNSVRLTVLSSGNVGIGTQLPNQNLTVVGNISASGYVAGNTNMNVQPASATTYNIAITDNGGVIGSLNNAAGLTAIIVGTYPVGFQTALMQLSGSTTTGRVTVSAGPGITLNQANGFFKTTKQYSAATLVNTGTTAGWILFGDVSA